MCVGCVPCQYLLARSLAGADYWRVTVTTLSEDLKSTDVKKVLVKFWFLNRNFSDPQIVLWIQTETWGVAFTKWGVIITSDWLMRAITCWEYSSITITKLLQNKSWSGLSSETFQSNIETGGFSFQPWRMFSHANVRHSTLLLEWGFICSVISI